MSTLLTLLSPFICLHHLPCSQTGSSEQSGKIFKYLRLFGGHQNANKNSLLPTAAFFAGISLQTFVHANICWVSGRRKVPCPSPHKVKGSSPILVHNTYLRVTVTLSFTDMWESNEFMPCYCSWIVYEHEKVMCVCVNAQVCTVQLYLFEWCSHMQTGLDQQPWTACGGHSMEKYTQRGVRGHLLEGMGKGDHDITYSEIT